MDIKRMETVNPWLGLVSVLLALVGIAITIGLYLRAQKHSKAMQKLLATRPLEIFPEYLAELSEMIESAQYRMDILCAYPQHGAYSSPGYWRLLESAIESVLKKKHVASRLIFSNAEQRISADFNQFDTAHADWKSWSSANKENILEYLQSHSSVCRDLGLDENAPEKSIERLEDWFWFQDECEKATVRQWKRLSMDNGGNATILESGDLMPLFAWIIDKDREAIFTFMTYNHHGIGAAFRTTDKRIIDNLFSLVERYQNLSEEFDDGHEPSKQRGRLNVQLVHNGKT